MVIRSCSLACCVLMAGNERIRELRHYNKNRDNTIARKSKIENSTASPQAKLSYIQLCGTE